MPRQPRLWTHPNATVEVVNRTFQGRHLIQPSPRFNAIIVGALAKARERHGIEIYGGAFAANHFHLYLRAGSVRAQANFMRDFTRKLSIESGIAYDWKGSTFPERYRATEVSEEPEAQIGRLTYCLQHGCKEGLVGSPIQWPGVGFAAALMTGEPLKGIWIDRSGYSRARAKGKAVTLDDFTEELELPLAPLPCWQEVDAATRRDYVTEMVRQIEDETAKVHAAEGTSPLGVLAVLAGDPHFRPEELETPPKPLFHAFRQRVRRDMREALGLITTAYFDAAERLKAGDRSVSFPRNCFPSRLPFVDPASDLAWVSG